MSAEKKLARRLSVFESSLEDSMEDWHFTFTTHSRSCLKPSVKEYACEFNGGGSVVGDECQKAK